MAGSLDFLNHESSEDVEKTANDRASAHEHIPNVDAPDWYLKEWLAFLGKRQASLVNELGWDKSRANHVYHGKQAYKRDLVNEVSEWLEIQPFELLMPPQEAVALRNLRASAILIAKTT